MTSPNFTAGGLTQPSPIHILLVEDHEQTRATLEKHLPALLAIAVA